MRGLGSKFSEVTILGFQLLQNRFPFRNYFKVFITLPRKEKIFSMPRNRYFFMLPFFFLCITLLCFFHVCLFILVSNPHRFSQWQQALSSMALPFLNTKVKDLLRKLKPCGQCCLTPILVSLLWVLTVTCPNTEVGERRVHRSSLSGLGQGCSLLASVSVVISSLSSAWGTCAGPSRCFHQTLSSMDIEHLEWKDVPSCWAVEVCLRLGSDWESEEYRVLNVSFFKVTAAQKGWLGKNNVPLAKNPCPSWLLCWWIWLPENHRVPPWWLELLITCFHISTANLICKFMVYVPIPTFHEPSLHLVP